MSSSGGSNFVLILKATIAETRYNINASPTKAPMIIHSVKTEEEQDFPTSITKLEKKAVGTTKTTILIEGSKKNAL